MNILQRAKYLVLFFPFSIDVADTNGNREEAEEQYLSPLHRPSFTTRNTQRSLNIRAVTMPKYRCITLSIMSQWEMKQFPEFPHPDSLQHKYRGPALGVDGSDPEPTSSPTTSKSSRTADVAEDQFPSVSCYIPSVPGTY
jgi:hypothetical protein